jgi:uncharacterized damage-inducible protein DinB
MVHRSMLMVVWLAGALLAGTSQAAAQYSFLAPLKAQWESTRSLVTGIVGIVPEEKYGFKPTPEVRSFLEQFQHLIWENYRFMAQAVGEQPPVELAAIEKIQSRDEIVKGLAESYEYGARVWATMDDKKAMEMIPGRAGQQQMRWAPILLNIVDNMDHYGNLVVYVRLNGMVPPRTAAQQQPQQQQR